MLGISDVSQCDSDQPSLGFRTFGTVSIMSRRNMLSSSSGMRVSNNQGMPKTRVPNKGSCKELRKRRCLIYRSPRTPFHQTAWIAELDGFGLPLQCCKDGSSGFQDWSEVDESRLHRVELAGLVAECQRRQNRDRERERETRAKRRKNPKAQKPRETEGAIAHQPKSGCGLCSRMRRPRQLLLRMAQQQSARMRFRFEAQP